MSFSGVFFLGKTRTISFLALRFLWSSTWCVLEFIWYDKIDNQNL